MQSEEPAGELGALDRARYDLRMFLEGVLQELNDPGRVPSVDQVVDIHVKFGAVYHEWLRSVGRHP
jgi:hypothetical protein